MSTAAGAATASAIIAGVGVGVQGYSVHQNLRNAKKARGAASEQARKQEEQADKLFDEQKSQFEMVEADRAKERLQTDSLANRSAAARLKKKTKGKYGRSDTILTGSRGIDESNEKTYKKTIGG